MTRNSQWRSSAQAGHLEMPQEDVCRNCPCMVGRMYSWKQVLVLTACIMGILAALSAVLVAILR